MTIVDFLTARSPIPTLEEADLYEALGLPVPPKQPELPPEVWNTNPVDAERAIAAVRSMCRSA